MPNQPNILFIIADDHRHDAIHAISDPTVKTPVLDSLIEGGTAFRRAHIMGGLSGAVCVPTRACMMTGAHTFTATASRDMANYRALTTINQDMALMPETFRQAGYHTFATGKWHNDKASFARCFTDGGKIFFGGMSDHLEVPTHDFDPTGTYSDEVRYMSEEFSTDLFADSAIQFLENYDDDAPFFLYAAFTAPHDPRMAPQPYADMYAPDDIPVPENFLPEHPFDNGDMRLRDEALDVWPRTPEIAQTHIAEYYAMITHLDAHIGRILDTLSARGLADDTIVVYTADHGLSVGQHGLLGKQNMYDHSIRVPSIIRGPGVPAGRQVDALTFSYDMFPTLCDLTGVTAPDTIESQSLTPLMTGETAQIRESVFSVYKDIQRMVSTGDWKLIRYYVSAVDGAGVDRIQLFNLADDPWETHDLSQDPAHQDRVQAMAAELSAWQQRVDDPLADRDVALT